MLSLILLFASLSLIDGYHIGTTFPRTPHAMVSMRTTTQMMAGFGAAAGGSGKKAKAAGGKKKVAKPADLSPKRQWDKFKELVSDGAPRVKVYGGLDGKWVEVGEVAVKANSGTAEQAAQFNKRLILEHAPRVELVWKLKARELVVGIAGSDGEPTLLTKQDVPEGLSCGFEGAPDSTGMYSKVGRTNLKSDPTATMPGSAAR